MDRKAELGGAQQQLQETRQKLIADPNYEVSVGPSTLSALLHTGHSTFVRKLRGIDLPEDPKNKRHFLISGGLFINLDEILKSTKPESRKKKQIN